VCGFCSKNWGSCSVDTYPLVCRSAPRTLQLGADAATLRHASRGGGTRCATSRVQAAHRGQTCVGRTSLQGRVGVSPCLHQSESSRKSTCQRHSDNQIKTSSTHYNWYFSYLCLVRCSILPQQVLVHSVIFFSHCSENSVLIGCSPLLTLYHYSLHL
jgi:hypothetical protein